MGIDAVDVPEPDERRLRRQIASPSVERPKGGHVGGTGVELGALEGEFVQVAASYGARQGISYTSWREIGVPAAVLQQAGIARIA